MQGGAGQGRAGQGRRDAEDWLKEKSEAITGPTQHIVSKQGRGGEGERELGRDASDPFICMDCLLQQGCHVPP